MNVPVIRLDDWRHTNADGAVYFILEADPLSDWVKIGFTAYRPRAGVRTGRAGIDSELPDPIDVGVSVGDRLASLQVGNPRPLILYAVVPATRRQERRVHELLAEHRGSGEWFDLPGFTEYADARYLVDLIEQAQQPAQQQLFHS